MLHDSSSIRDYANAQNITRSRSNFPLLLRFLVRVIFYWQRDNNNVGTTVCIPQTMSVQRWQFRDSALKSRVTSG